MPVVAIRRTCDDDDYIKDHRVSSLGCITKALPDMSQRSQRHSSHPYDRFTNHARQDHNAASSDESSNLYVPIAYNPLDYIEKPKSSLRKPRLSRQDSPTNVATSDPAPTFTPVNDNPERSLVLRRDADLAVATIPKPPQDDSDDNDDESFILSRSPSTRRHHEDDDGYFSDTSQEYRKATHLRPSAIAIGASVGAIIACLSGAGVVAAAATVIGGAIAGRKVKKAHQRQVVSYRISSFPLLTPYSNKHIRAASMSNTTHDRQALAEAMQLYQQQMYAERLGMPFGYASHECPLDAFMSSDDDWACATPRSQVMGQYAAMSMHMRFSTRPRAGR